MALMTLIQSVNFQVPFGRWHLFEISDLEYVPSLVKHLCQNTLTAQWTKKLPIIQRQTPAELAANAILDALNTIEDIDSAQWTIIDFCSGGGGPIPVIERHINRHRKLEGKQPIQFRLSDIVPNLDAWMAHASRSDNLSFVPQPVDASFPPFSVISTTTPGDKQAAADQGLVSNGSKVFRLFCLSFHHFDDEQAKRVIKSTLETSDAFAIIELQDRCVGSLALMLLEYWLLFIISALWFWHNRLHLLLTYCIPVLPAIHCFDGFVSCLRTRTFAETMHLVEDVQGGKAAVREDSQGRLRRGHWVFSHSRSLHTWPVGYMDFTFGKKIEGK
ncbi:hypothetical protein LTR78_004978 [Recurvomyces mirabilis]|uniref:Uncharacterized protein n=1 Tax=Recurvomyces mirabilis TaxID=574656 RepID=A0AAE1C244_9PEZI|nr:hypothetical protein LTR78_004978 [Recurvomyces mirabilis]